MSVRKQKGKKWRWHRTRSRHLQADVATKKVSCAGHPRFPGAVLGQGGKAFCPVGAQAGHDDHCTRAGCALERR